MSRALRPSTEIQAPSSASECSRLRRVVYLLAYGALHDQNAVADIELAVGEAFSNVVKHGSQDSKVSVRLESPSRQKLAVELIYLGGKFDTTISCPKNLRNATGGFGRFIIQQVMDSMEYSFRNGLTTLRMTKAGND